MRLEKLFHKPLSVLFKVKLLKSRCDEGICEKKKRMENLSHVGVSVMRALS